MLTHSGDFDMRPFPWKCRKCGKRAVNSRTIDYTTVKEHDGRAYSLTIPNLEVYECDECHERTLPDRSSDKVTDALRAAAGLLMPDEIRDNRKRMGLNQEALANYLRVAKETVSRWETGGQIQQRAMDLLLRVFFGVPFVRLWLDNPSIFSVVRAPMVSNSGQATVLLKNYNATTDPRSYGSVTVMAAPRDPLAERMRAVLPSR
jgi:putative zinc finger/helix-turn-helix YgiT family protein